jgi:transmembrane sensor
MQKVTDELIEKFLSGLCTKEEAASVCAYLEAQPDHNFLWKEFELTDGSSPLPGGYSEEMLGVILDKTTEKKRSFIRPIWGWVAASLVLVVGGWIAVKWAHHTEQKAPMVALVPSIKWIQEVNQGSTKKSVSLPDKSTVILSPGSGIAYRSDFGHYDSRDVRVYGNVFFIAAKDKDRSFVVHSSGIATTALGTSFEVLADSSQPKIMVQLFTGKVMVATEGGAIPAQTCYLMPGQEMVYDKASGHMSIDKFDLNHNGHITLPEIRQVGLDNWYMFNNQDLGTVFEQLSAIYSVNIQYSESQIRSMYLIGKLDRRDSLEEILQDIALLNHLKVTRSKYGYLIKK